MAAASAVSMRSAQPPRQAANSPSTVPGMAALKTLSSAIDSDRRDASARRASMLRPR